MKWQASDEKFLLFMLHRNVWFLKQDKRQRENLIGRGCYQWCLMARAHLQGPLCTRGVVESFSTRVESKGAINKLLGENFWQSPKEIQQQQKRRAVSKVSHRIFFHFNVHFLYLILHKGPRQIMWISATTKFGSTPVCGPLFLGDFLRVVSQYSYDLCL